MWILTSPRSEFLFLYLPGLLGLLFAILIPDLGESSLLYALIATALVDSGHVYTTAWRTLLSPAEFRSSKSYLILPLFFFFAFSAWYGLGAYGLWKFIVYATIFHHVRQLYGINKWYQSLNGRVDRNSDYFLYFLSVIPFLAYHFRPGVPANYYSQEDLFLFPFREVYLGFCVLFITGVIFWLVYEYKLFVKGIREPNRFVGVFFPAILYGQCFLLAQTLSQVLFPLLLSHGIAYMAILALSLERTQRDRFRSFWIALFVIVLTAAFFGGLESFWEEGQSEFTSGLPLFLRASLIGATLTPLFCHYAFDARIWKKGHREGALVFRKPPAQ